MKTCVVTCTGARWGMFALCKRWVERQTKKPDCWIVSTDTGEPLPPDVEATHVAIPACPKAIGRLPTGRAMWALHQALEKVPHNHSVVVMEDDDWYSERHVEEAVAQLASHPVIQIDRPWRHFLPVNRFSRGPSASPNFTHKFVPGIASFRWEMIETVRESLLDGAATSIPISFYESDTVVSIKGVGHGLEGRAGATSRHIPNHPKTLRGLIDKDHSEFRARIGAIDAQAYLDLLL